MAFAARSGSHCSRVAARRTVPRVMPRAVHAPAALSIRVCAVRCFSNFSIPEPYVWSADFATDDEELDTQHKGLFAGIDALCKNPGDEGTLNTVVAAVVAHFETEEAKLKAAGCMCDQHKAKHDQLLEQAGGLKVPLTGDQQQFLKQWLVDHIKATDIPSYGGKLG